MLPGITYNDRMGQNEGRGAILLLRFPFPTCFHEDAVLPVLSFVSARSVLRRFEDKPEGRSSKNEQQGSSPKLELRSEF